MGKNIKRDYSLKKYKERYDYIENHINNETYNKSKWISHKSSKSDSNAGGPDYNLEKATQYLLESSDIESERQLEYSFFIDDEKFNREYKYKKKKLKDKDRDYYSEDDYVIRSVLTDFKNSEYSDLLKGLYDDYVGKDIEVEITNINIVEILSLYHTIDSISNIDFYIYVKSFIENLVSDIIKRSNDSLDLKILYLLINGESIKDISKKLDVPNRTVYNRINKFYKKKKNVN